MTKPKKDMTESASRAAKSRTEVEFFTIYGNLIGGGFEIITGGSDIYEAQRVAAHLCDLNGSTVKIEC